MGFPTQSTVELIQKGGSPRGVALCQPWAKTDLI